MTVAVSAVMNALENILHLEDKHVRSIAASWHATVVEYMSKVLYFDIWK